MRISLCSGGNVHSHFAECVVKQSFEHDIVDLDVDDENKGFIPIKGKGKGSKWKIGSSVELFGQGANPEQWDQSQP